jgi:hypothetical protein
LRAGSREAPPFVVRENQTSPEKSIEFSNACWFLLPLDAVEPGSALALGAGMTARRPADRVPVLRRGRGDRRQRD